MANGFPEMLHETLLTEAWQNAEIAAVVFDEGQEYLTANRAYLSLVGYSYDEIKDKAPGANILTDEEGRLAYVDLVTQHPRLDGSTPIRRKDGSLLIVDYVIVRTSVSTLPFFMALMWPSDGAAIAGT